MLSSMYTILLSLHSVIRWLVLASLLYCLYISYKGFVKKMLFTAKEDAIRHWTATIAHVQLVVGFTLYIKSPLVHFFWSNSPKTTPSLELSFFGWMHILLMLLAIVIITVGSAKAKRKKNDHEKFKTLFIWFGLALFLIFLAIPWPFSPFVTRPYIRPF